MKRSTNTAPVSLSTSYLIGSACAGISMMTLNSSGTLRPAGTLSRLMTMILEGTSILLTAGRPSRALLSEPRVYSIIGRRGNRETRHGRRLDRDQRVASLHRQPLGSIGDRTVDRRRRSLRRQAVRTDRARRRRGRRRSRDGGAPRRRRRAGRTLGAHGGHRARAAAYEAG